MYAKELIDEYRKKISEILECDTENIIFKIDKEVNTFLNYDKEGQNEGLYLIILKEDGKFDKTISSWRLIQFPGCCAFCISTGVFVYKEFRSKGIGKVLNNFRKDVSKFLGFTSLICTDIETNTHQRKLLKSNGWKDIYSITNKRTKNLVNISIINL